MDWSNKTVLVTGGGGFIGSHLCERLIQRGANVRALVLYNSAGSNDWLDHSPYLDQIDVTLGDLLDRDSMVKAVKGADVIFHLGALIAIPYSYSSPQSYVQTNVQGTLNVLQLARDFNVSRVIHTSTSEVYGSAQFVPITEEHPLVGQSPYSASKIGADMMAESFYRSFELPVSTIRPFNTYGPRQSARAIIPTVISQALVKDQIHLGSLAPTRDLTFVHDTADGFIRMAECDNVIGETINLGVGKEISIGDLAQKIIKLIGRDVEILCDEERLRPKASEVERLCSDNSKALELMNWQPATSLDQGLGLTIEWVKDNIDKFKVGQYTV
ncbi:SDR family NAD(P)-dependent oxidoreductase [Terasakiella sp. A23]|uniref:SDR family NAD(P)-dependent oxidoreductase n=1 Tax=Terasakiella sp. FCG-A23 TaxID=3080561 RepID=UPI002955A929|nr:SDR family NAD(P)-dependent oxidoreductase [Terasakiella sp. A23]MDV7340808.1 SDR family NAD(P)-dependent oxidoreductase [Terasakiella sp. A23]